MKEELTIKKVTKENVSSFQILEVFDREGIEWNEIGSNNWKEQYPYTPQASFRIAHNYNSILLEYKVEEETIRAMADRDNGRPWEDSCCEFFFAPGISEDNPEDLYYNIECNCRGALLVACGKGREKRVEAPVILVDSIDRLSSLGEGKMEERPAKGPWTLTLVLPKRLFFKHHKLSLEGLKARGNFYKCGDKLSKPHFLSWNAIDVPAPDFHVPEYFGTLNFE